MANGQKKSQRLASISIVWAMLQIVQFACSATPFWGGESGMVFSYVMPLVLQCASIWPQTSLGTLSMWRIAILSLQWFSAAAWYLTKSCSTSLCDFMRKRDVNREKQSMNNIKYEKFL